MKTITYIDDATFGALIDRLKEIDAETEEERDNAIHEALIIAGIAPKSYKELWEKAGVAKCR